MIAAQRQREILNEIVKEGSVRVADLATRLHVTEETIRRDLDKLEDTGKIRRSHGGAVLADQGPQESPHWAREQINRAEKNAIAQAAASRVEPGDTIILDASSTAYYFAAHLPDIPLTVITNSSKVAIALADQDQVKVICIGGTLSPKSLSFVGPVAERNLSEFNADKAFLSCGAVDERLGLSDANELQAELRRLMIKQSAHHTLMCDHSKFGARALAHIADMSAFDEVITDNAIDGSFRSKLADCVETLTIVDVSAPSQRLDERANHGE
jgi:DeoR/GlpR family transcriptional regulator of sugar metabolism